MDFIADLNRVLKYSADTVENLLTQLSHPDHNATRWGQGDHIFRGVLADALQENDRHTEADLLRQPDQHVVVQDGKVRAGRFTDRPVRDAERRVLQHVEQWSGEPAHWYPEIGWSDESGSPRYHNPDLWAGEEEPEGNHPYGTLEVTHFDNDQSNNHTHHLHYSQLGGHLEDQIRDYVNNDDYGWNIVDDDDPNEVEYQKRMTELRNAPFEEVDHRHQSEKKG
jgi:hypothetical protein